MIEIKDTTSPATQPAPHQRDAMRSIGRGLRGACPACGRGSIFRKYLKVHDTCLSCGTELHHHQADDAPPYMTIFIVGHIVVPLLLWVEKGWHPAEWVHAVLWLPLTLLLVLVILPSMKGALIGLQWALRMHGFGEAESEMSQPRASAPAG